MVWAGVCAAGCGKSLVPGTAYDQPLLPLFGGRILPVGGLGDAERPTVTLLWTDPFQKKPAFRCPRTGCGRR